MKDVLGVIYIFFFSRLTTNDSRVMNCPAASDVWVWLIMPEVAQDEGQGGEGPGPSAASLILTQPSMEGLLTSRLWRLHRGGHRYWLMDQASPVTSKMNKN